MRVSQRSRLVDHASQAAIRLKNSPVWAPGARATQTKPLTALCAEFVGLLCALFQTSGLVFLSDRDRDLGKQVYLDFERSDTPIGRHTGVPAFTARFSLV